MYLTSFGFTYFYDKQNNTNKMQRKYNFKGGINSHNKGGINSHNKGGINSHNKGGIKREPWFPLFYMNKYILWLIVVIVMIKIE